MSSKQLLLGTPSSPLRLPTGLRTINIDLQQLTISATKDGNDIQHLETHALSTAREDLPAASEDCSADKTTVTEPTSLQKMSKYLIIRNMLDKLLDMDIRYLTSAAALMFSLCVLFNLMNNNATKICQYLHAAPAIVLWLILLLYLAALEGVQAGVVALEPVPKAIYKDSHPWTYAITTWCHTGNALDRFLVGRQFLVIFVVFLISFCSGVDDERLKSNPLSISDQLMDIVVNTGLVSALVTIIIGQLVSQIIASRCNIDFLNYRVNYYGVVGVCLFMEATGLMHFVYIIQKLTVHICGGQATNLESAGEKRRTELKENDGNPVLFWIRVVLSTAVLAFSLAVSFKSLFEGWTNLEANFPSIPNGAGLVIFFVLTTYVGLLEGLQVSLFALQHIDTEVYRASHPRAHSNTALVFNGSNLQSFLLGRQLLTATCMFMLSLICSVQPDLGEDGNKTVFGVPAGLQQALFETGLVGALVLTILGSLTGQMIASAFPVGFCNLPGMGMVLWSCLVMEFCGFTHAAWPLADAVRCCFGDRMRDNSHYVGKLQAEPGPAQEPASAPAPVREPAPTPANAV